MRRYRLHYKQNLTGPDWVLLETVQTQIKCRRKGLLCMLRKKRSFRERNTIYVFWEIITYDPSIYILNHTDFIVGSFIESSIEPSILQIWKIF